jgi:transposase-like protein DUF772
VPKKTGVELHLAYRWFCRLDLDDKVPNHSTFSVKRHGRFRDRNLFRNVFEAVVRTCMDGGLVKGEVLPSTRASWKLTPAAITARLPTRLTGRHPNARRGQSPSSLRGLTGANASTLTSKSVLLRYVLPFDALASAFHGPRT